MEYSVLQLSFEVFAFKNDIRFWREKKSLAGISRRSGTEKIAAVFWCDKKSHK